MMFNMPYYRSQLNELSYEWPNDLDDSASSFDEQHLYEFEISALMLLDIERPSDWKVGLCARNEYGELVFFTASIRNRGIVRPIPLGTADERPSRCSWRDSLD